MTPCTGSLTKLRVLDLGAILAGPAIGVHIGADARSVLRDCGYADAGIDSLAREGIIAAP